MSSNYASGATRSLYTRATCDAARYAQQEHPALLAAAMKRCETFATDHQNADEVEGVAKGIVAACLPQRFRLGYGPDYAAPAPEGREVFTLSTTAARTACDQAAAAVARSYRESATLDALTASDPGAIERLSQDVRGDTRLTLSRYAPDPQSKHATTTEDRLAAALVAVHPEHVEILATAYEAWERHGTFDARSIVAAVAMANGWTNASKERKAYERALKKALADLAPYAAQVLANPHGRATEQTTARTPARPYDRANGEPGHGGRIDATRRAAQRRARQEAKPQARAERWTPEQDNERSRSWAPTPRTAETTFRDLTRALRQTRQAQRLISRPGALAGGRYDPSATDPTTASHVIVRTASGTVEVRDAVDGHTLAVRPADAYADLMSATRQPSALAPRKRDALTPGLPDQARAERHAAAPRLGAPAKASGRKRATTGSTGPTVPDRGGNRR